MAVRQAKGFYHDIEGNETFKMSDQNQNVKKTDAGIVMEIAGEKTNVQKIFLSKQKDLTGLTGNPIQDTFTRLNQWIVEQNKIKIKDLATMFRLLAVMINAGIPLIKCLNTLGVQQEKSPKLARVLFELAKSVEDGRSFSHSMDDHKEVFSDSQIGAIQAGEESGQLNKTLLDLATELEKTAAINGKVKGAMVYPMVVLVILGAVIGLMMTFVIPQLKGLFTSTGKELPAPTKIMMSISDFTISYWWLILLFIVGAVSLIKMWKSTKTGRYYWDLMILKTPVFGALVQKTVLSKFSRSFGNLLSSGVPIVRAMEIVANGVGNEVYRRRFLLTAEDMKSGIPMAENMSSSKLFPTMLVNMIEVGEQTAQLENVTKKVAKFYDDEVNTAVKALTKIMEPMIMVLVGGVVGGLVAAIMLPIMAMTDIAGSL
jgi:type IV pilus assembly protein PilC